MGIGNERGIEIFKRAKALLKGHYRLNGGMDGLEYVAKGLIWENDPEGGREICQGISDDVIDKEFEIDTIVGPWSGAIPYADCTAEILSRTMGKKITSVHALKCEDGKNFYFREEDLVHISGKRILVIEDVFTSGGSCARTVVAIRHSGGIVVAVEGVWNRGGVSAEDIGVENFGAQITHNIPTFEPGEETCRGCREKIPYDMNLGHGKTLVGKHPLAIAS